MKKKPLIIAGIVVGVILIVLLAIPLVINVDNYRPMIERQLASSLGRPVQIGHLSLSIFAGGITADDISIGDDPAFSNEPFLKAKSLEVGVNLWPMIFSRSLQVNSLTLVEPEVSLLRSPAGKWNFSSLGSTAATPASAPHHGRARQPEEAAPAPASSSASSNFSVAVLKVENGKILVGQTGRRNLRTYEKVNAEVKDVSYTSRMPFKLDAQMPGGGSMKVDGTAGPINRTDASATPMSANVNVDHMDLASSGFIDPASGMSGVVTDNSKIKSDGKTIHTEGLLNAAKLKLVKTGAPARQPLSVDYATDYDVARQAGTLTKGVIRTGKSGAYLTGTYDTHGPSTVLHMNLRGTNLPINDIEGLLPALGVILPSGSSLQGGTATANLNIAGPLDHLVTSGPVSLANTRLAGFNLGSKMSGIAALAGVKTGSDTNIQSMATELTVAPEAIRAQNLTLVVPSLGSVAGNGTISGPNNALNFKMLAKLANGGGLIGGVSQIASFGQKKGTIPFLVQGTTSNPIFVPDVGAAIGSTVAAPAQGVGGILGGIFGKKKQQ